MRSFHSRLIAISLFLLAFSLTIVAQRTAQKPAGTDREKQAAAELKSLRDLRARLEKIPFNGEEREPHKSFLKANEKSVTYNEPAGQWIVRSDKFWELREKYSDLAIADDIAWEAAQNTIPGECEGYMNCGIYLSQLTAVKYLGFYPSGKYSKAALGEMKDMFGAYADLSQAGTSYTPPEDEADKAELQKMLREIDAVLSKVNAADAAEVRGFIKQIADRYK